jgi:hypothetical protein
MDIEIKEHFNSQREALKSRVKTESRLPNREQQIANIGRMFSPNSRHCSRQ